ncbi:Portal protein [uncultured Caudovirales phage]|uniref:Portal protein n=1 Tax=uncultured Caudovirales phage TaxID=2100421 RepID=A0A6J5L4P2_9CAUD|nr:Portal protein [uncultured Caudovirales phage]CAB5219471.1 Portal protein [uncultured Caudovirales phage]
MSFLDFSPPSYRASSSDLTISISPLGLVELADEEFEVHGPRLNRYSLNWAMYLGHHWGYRREQGEMQISVNYYRAFIDYIARFTFGNGVHFRSPKATEAIVPDRLERVWEIDNDKQRVLFEIAQTGAITGDAFIKVAYEEAWEDSIGRYHPGRVRVLPLNPAFCFPEFHPHDRSRLLRFKQKYRFWGTSLEGTRQVFTYTEILTDDIIEEYINDELIDSRPNPLGLIPVVHIPNIPVSGSPWGLADAHDIITINRSYNEISTDIADIINYHAAPVTVIVGAKASNLEKGAKKVWGGLPKDSQVFNLEGGGAGIQGALTYLQTLKTSMHEIMNVPETALGQVQPISNTSGVALSIQFQPLMNRWSQKSAQYGKGLEKVNELIILNLAVKEPETLLYNPEIDGPLKEGQQPQLDPDDPLTYVTYAHFPPPLPLDKLVLLNELGQKMSMGLESKEGALRALGEEFPEEKLEEIRKELQEDALAEGALNLVKAQVQKQLMDLTGMMVGPDGTATPMDPMMLGDGDVLGDGELGPQQPEQTPEQADAAMQSLEQESEIRNALVTQAYGTQVPARRTVDKD